jgi:hypothetical protein
LVRNHFLLHEPGAASRSRSFLETALFFLNLFPPYNVICWLWIKAHLRLFAGAAAATRFARWLIARGFLFGALRHLRPEDKNDFAASLQLRPRHGAAQPAPTPAGQAAAQVADAGYAALGRLVAAEEVPEAVRYFRNQAGYISQVPLQSDGVLRPFDVEALRRRSAARYFCFPPRTSLKCPQLAAVLRDPRLSAIACAYLGYVPRLYSVNTFATLEGDADHYVMRLHRDYDDFKSLAFFIYWTGTSADNGATVYVPGSHVSSKAPREKITHLVGEAGAGYAIDTFGLHSGNRSVESFRLVTWVRYGQSPNLATVQDGWLIPGQA